MNLQHQPGVWNARTAADTTQGLRVTADRPILATMRNFTAGDLSSTTTASIVAGRTATIIPAADNVLVLAGAPSNGTVVVVQRSADGRNLGSTKVSVGPEQASVVKLARQAAVIVVDVPAGGLAAAVLSQSGSGATVLPLGPLIDAALIPAVAPMLP